MLPIIHFARLFASGAGKISRDEAKFMTHKPATPTRPDARILWQPTEQQIKDSNLFAFATMVAARQNSQEGWNGDYHELWQWSIDDSPAFWDALWDWQGVIGEKGARKIADKGAMPGTRFFPDADKGRRSR